MKTKLQALLTLLTLAAGACKTAEPHRGPATFDDDVAELGRRAETIVLTDAKGTGQVAVVPSLQGRVVTSTLSGGGGLSLGGVRRGEAPPGEDRFWIGPEGGQFGLFFAPGAKFDRANWRAPAALDAEPFELVEKTTDRATFRKRLQLTNYAGTNFEIEVTREVRMRDAAQVLAAMRFELPDGVRAVAFESVNTIANTGRQAWKKEQGLVSIWIQGTFPAPPGTVVAIPFQTGTESIRGPIVDVPDPDAAPGERMTIRDEAGVLLFQAGGDAPSKFGLGPKRVHDLFGSYDPERRVLTIVQYALPRNPAEYVSSAWKRQDDPYAGDVLGCASSGSGASGSRASGATYALGTSSPALALKPGARATHVHRTLHLQGDERLLDGLAKQVLGVGIGEMALFARR
jgi:hypothetical protein